MFTKEPTTNINAQVDAFSAAAQKTIAAVNAVAVEAEAKAEEEALRTKLEALDKVCTVVDTAIGEAFTAITTAKNAKAAKAENADACVAEAKFKVVDALEELNKGLIFITENLSERLIKIITITDTCREELIRKLATLDE